MNNNFLISRFYDDVDEMEIISSYDVGLVKINITKTGKYIVQEPQITSYGEQIYFDLLKTIRQSVDAKKFSNGNLIESIMNAMEEESRKSGEFEIWNKSRIPIEYYLKRNLIGYAEIDPLMNDPNIEDITSVLYSKPVFVIHNKFSDFTSLSTNISFKSEDDMSNLIQRVSQRYGDPPTEAKPSTSFTNEHNVRFTFTGNKKITPNGCTIEIRIPSEKIITIFNLIDDGIVTPLVASYLWIMSDLKSFGFIIGTPSSGKTTMINSIFTMSHPNWHYFTIEDVLELRLQHQNVSTHQTIGNDSIQGESDKQSYGTIFDLCRLALRSRPDFVIVGETLGSEANGLFQVGASGCGTISSFHASDPLDALTRLESPPLNISPITTNLISYILHIAWIERKGKRMRRVLEIVEPTPIYKDGTMRKIVSKIFLYDTISDRLSVVPTKNKSTDDEIQMLINRSTELEKAVIKLGITDMYHNLKQRIGIIQKIINEKNQNNFEAISKEIFKFYKK